MISIAGSSQSSCSSTANARSYRNSQSSSQVSTYYPGYLEYGGMGYAERYVEAPSPWFPEAFVPHDMRPFAGDGVHHQMPMQSMRPMNPAVQNSDVLQPMHTLQAQTQMQQAAAQQLQLHHMRLQQLQMQQSQLQRELQDRRTQPQLHGEELYQAGCMLWSTGATDGSQPSLSCAVGRSPRSHRCPPLRCALLFESVQSAHCLHAHKSQAPNPKRQTKNP